MGEAFADNLNIPDPRVETAKKMISHHFFGNESSIIITNDLTVTVDIEWDWILN